jgi:hypothetical protein
MVEGSESPPAEDREPTRVSNGENREDAPPGLTQGDNADDQGHPAAATGRRYVPL